MPPVNIGSQNVTITTTTGSDVGTVNLPNAIVKGDGTVTIEQATIPDGVKTGNVLSPVVNVTLYDANGNVITDLNGEKVQLCLDVPNPNKKDKSCLAYLDETKNPPEWKCVDKCLKSSNGSQLCGDTDHFTSFAVLFEGTDNSERCDYDATLSWISLGAIIGAILCCCFWIPVLEIYHRWLKAHRMKGARRRQKAKRMESVSNTFALQSTESEDSKLIV